MKTMYGFILAVITFVYFTGCDNKDHYVDLETGKTISVEKDSTTGYMVNAETKNPVGIYVNTETHDTIDGRTGKVINNLVTMRSDGKFTYQEETDGDYKVKGEDYKKKVEEDGDVKIKHGDDKIKIEEDGEKKVKSE
jgi:hypothetical protein